MGDLNLSTSGVDHLLAQTRQVLEKMRAPAAPDAVSDGESDAESGAEPMRGEGNAADGKVHAVVATPGRIESLEMDPRLMRDGSEAVCSAIVTAVNAALQDLQDKALGAAAPADFGDLSGDLEQLQAESLDSAHLMFGALQDAMDRIDRRS